MINGCLNTLISGAKTLLGKKPTQDILKYLATVTLSHVANKYKVNQYKYDPIDMKNMVYHYNMNNDRTINKDNVDQMIDIMNINRFINELAYKNNSSDDYVSELVSQVINIMNDKKLNEIYDDMLGNDIVQQFDTDTIETSSIADNYEISSGGIYLPDNNVYTSTIEGCNLANAKNDYLTKRIKLGEDASENEVRELLNEYYNKINFEKVLHYFNN